ncbi:asparagine amidase a [Sporothrix brasiliensis 5110]|uniref:Asparagine amidase a n=1 Tax=Sporothrix brasiliensis 5110 TaxID=1398154 RepID=A0A0C2FQ54_9PEZI|nr:asparagine amidase a [Sporothrix brasiliensis 5110]KIH93138.1 asparagine amidase a [Sporothrix brasiliensis 5110]
MDEAGAPLLEKDHWSAVEPETTKPRTSKYGRRPTMWLRFASILLPVAFTLAVVLALASHLRPCLPSAAFNRPHINVAGHTAPVGPISVSKRAGGDSSPTASSSTSTPAATVLDCFQVAPPVLTPDGPATERSSGPSSASGAVTVTLMEHVFGNSYNAPFVGSYVPPATPFNRVVMNFTAVSAGRQFDRLALMYLNDTEVWRTSTAEPVKAPGIRWVYLKDMTAYLALWRAPQKIIFDLGNLQNEVYTASFNVTLTATFFQSDVGDRLDAAPPSDAVIPISKRQSDVNGVSQFTLPADVATNTITDFPRNARRAVFSVSANGQANEEFWWTNVLQSDTLTFNATDAGVFPGFSPFREVQVLIDGRLAGVQWPFPVVFTGGVVPSLHRPIVGADVFDLREHEIDISPWLPVLCDGQPHTFSILVAGLDDDGQPSGVASLTKQVAASWYVTGKIFVWLDDNDGDDSSALVTTGTPPVVHDSGVAISVTQHLQQNATGANQTLTYSVSVARSFSVQGTLRTGAKGPRAVSWSQSLSYANEGVLTDFGNNQINNFTLSGSDKASGDGDAASKYSYSTNYAYPTFCNTTTNISPQGNLTLWALLDQGLQLEVAGAGVFSTGLEAFAGAAPNRFASSRLSTRAVGTASFFQTGDGKNSSGFGSTTQYLHFGGVSAAGVLSATGPDVELYMRNVTAVNQTIVHDSETALVPLAAGAATEDTGTGTAAPASLAQPAYQYAQAPLHGGTGTRVFMGRGGPDPAVADDRLADSQAPLRAR